MRRYCEAVCSAMLGNQFHSLWEGLGCGSLDLSLSNKDKGKGRRLFRWREQLVALGIGLLADGSKERRDPRDDSVGKRT